jgi:hypothetical protein
LNTQALLAVSGSGIFLLLSRRSHTNGRSSASLSSAAVLLTHKAAIGVMSVTVMSVTTDPRYYGPYPSQLLIPRPPPDSCGSWAVGRPVKGGTRRGETPATALACRIICLRPPQPGVTFLGRVQGRNLPGQVVIPGRRSQLVDAHRHNQPRGYMPPWRSGRPKLLPMVHGCVTSDYFRWCMGV